MKIIAVIYCSIKNNAYLCHILIEPAATDKRHKIMKATQKAIKQAIKEGSTAVYKLAKQCGIDIRNKSLILDLLNQVNYMNNKKWIWYMAHGELNMLMILLRECQEDYNIGLTLKTLVITKK
jgi:hypothetical protein